MNSSGMPGKPKHLGVPNGRMVSVGSGPGPRRGVGTPRVEPNRHTRQGWAREVVDRQQQVVEPSALIPGPSRWL